MTRLIHVLLILILVQINCAPSLELTRFDSSPRPPKTGEIDIYTNPEAIEKPYKEIAIIKVTESDLGNKDQTMFDKLILKAKEIGADGIIVLSQATEPLSHWASVKESKRKIIRASAIVYEEEQ